jgi:Spy/CpxP family protein refolding chaperone
MQRRFQSGFLGILLAGASLSGYGQSAAPAQIPSPGQQSVGPHRTLEALGELRALTAQLNLTPEQREKVRPVVTEEGEQLRVIRLDEHLTPEQRTQKSREVREAYQPKIAAFLTPEQQEKFKKMQEAYQGKHAEGARESSAAPAPQK